MLLATSTCFQQRMHPAINTHVPTCPVTMPRFEPMQTSCYSNVLDTYTSSATPAFFNKKTYPAIAYLSTSTPCPND